MACYGTGTYKVCEDTAPTQPVVLPTPLLDTDLSPLCAQTQPTGWTTGGQAAACFVIGTTITMSGPLQITGTRPLVLVGSTSIAITQLLDASSHLLSGVTGPAAPSALCDVFVTNPQNSITTNLGGGGGAGGSFMAKGGNGGTGNSGMRNAGTAAPPDPANPTVLRGGCNGQPGGTGGPGNATGSVGRGGGALYLLSGGNISISSGVIIDVSGCAANAGAILAGGSGAGSGGMLKIYAGSLTTGGAKIFANGGGGSSGADATNTGVAGNDPIAVSTPAAGGKAKKGGDGGDGFAGVTAATDGGPGGLAESGGGGGGGGGYIESNLSLNGASVSAGVINAP
jgi:hypothetical protein